MSVNISSRNEDIRDFNAASALAGLAIDNGEGSQANNNKNNNDAAESNMEFHIPQRFTKSGRKRAVPFTIKLMKVLSDKNNAHIITWMPSGKSFNILKPKAFVAEILPHHFKTAKYSSFTRKLHRWGFMRHYRGDEAGAFYHKDFQRGRLDLVEEMTCHKAEPSKSAMAMWDVAPASAPKTEVPRPAVAVVKPMAVRPMPKQAPAMTAGDLKMPMTPSIASLPPASLPPSSLPSAPVAASAAAALEAERLNAAIEREVNRRLKERINAVTLSRQAFAVSALRSQRLASYGTHHHPSHNSPHSQTSQWAAALLLQKEAELLKGPTTLPLDLTGMQFRGFGSNETQLPSAPPRKNFPGARTA
ncbi:stress transcription factor B-2a [Seminavis robusta]|uniref:Stress transcription factor B-2a n=1 Tax=Seminavis robusta TaxID=568900 RepID=A0A9N8EQH9_9STRA|nr:stress transcription factor B-2a [Seminavis robusta]|eukprot:Sro1412_g270460.1 stress transcription factor B-2a (360) ;mRNA; r:7181-8416